MKRLLSIVIIAVLSLSMITVPVYAADSGVIGIGSITILPGDTPDPPEPPDPPIPGDEALNVIIPTSAGFVLNPYQLKIHNERGSDDMSSTVIGVYGDDYVQNAKEAGDSWRIINKGSTKVKGMVYATYETNRWLQVNAEGSDVDPIKRQLKLDLKIDSVSIPLLETAPDDWDSDNVVEFTIDNKEGSNIAKITISGSTGSGNKMWSYTDYCNITMAFKFEAA